MRILRLPGSSYVEKVKENAKHFIVSSPSPSCVTGKLTTTSRLLSPFGPESVLIELVNSSAPLSPYVVATLRPRTFRFENTANGSAFIAEDLTLLSIIGGGTIDTLYLVVDGEIIYSAPIQEYSNFHVEGGDIVFPELRFVFD